MEQRDKGSWWSRNWKWFVPVGCLSAIVLVVAFVAVIVVFVFSIMKSSDVYKEALAAATTNEIVIEALGTPIEPGLVISGNINVSGSSGDADIAIPISGPLGEATIYAVAAKSAGEWEYSMLVVQLEETGEQIDLLE
jgi:hypothetical protein